MRGGVSFLMVPVRELAALRRINMDRPALKAVLAPLGVSAAYVFAPEGVEPETDVHARLIDPDNAGEDPFTGSAAGCMATCTRTGCVPGRASGLSRAISSTAREPGNWN